MRCREVWAWDVVKVNYRGGDGGEPLGQVQGNRHLMSPGIQRASKHVVFCLVLFGATNEGSSRFFSFDSKGIVGCRAWYGHDIMICWLACEAGYRITQKIHTHTGEDRDNGSVEK